MRKILITLATSIALLTAPALSQAATKITYNTTNEQQVITLLNQIRAQHNLTPLTANTQLRNAARAHSSDMLRRNFFDHNSPTEAWDTRVARYIKAPLTGENIAWGTGTYGSPTGIVKQWMNSPPHRAIILTPELHRVGLGLATGTYQGTNSATMATADFAS